MIVLFSSSSTSPVLCETPLAKPSDVVEGEAVMIAAISKKIVQFSQK